MKLSNIGIELHVGSSLPSEWHQCLDLQVCSVFFLIIYCVFLLFMFVFFVVDVVEMKWIDHNSLTVIEEWPYRVLRDVLKMYSSLILT